MVGCRPHFPLENEGLEDEEINASLAQGHVLQVMESAPRGWAWPQCPFYSSRLPYSERGEI